MGNESPELAGQPTEIKATRTVSEDLTIEEIEAIEEMIRLHQSIRANPNPDPYLQDLSRLAQQLKRMMQKQIQGDEGQELATPTTETQPT